jgi:hypothetical protein
MYEPEQFPGLIHRMDDPKVVILLFASGKLVCTGAKKETEVHRAVMELKELLRESRSWDDKYTVDVLKVPNVIPFPSASLETISTGVRGTALQRMMKEAVDCPVKAKRVSFVECFGCSNFNRRIKGKVGCAGLPVGQASPPVPEPSAPQPKSTKFCSFCGAKVPYESKYCEECGNKLV